MLLLAPTVVTFALDSEIVVDEKAGTITIDGSVQYSSCTTDLVKETPIDPAFLPCEQGTAFVLFVDKTGAPTFGLHGVVDGATESSITLRGDDLLVVGDPELDVEVTSTDVYGIWGTDGAVIPDLLAVWGTDGAAIWGTDGAVVPADKAGMWSDDIVAIWGTGGVAVWGTDGAVIPGLLGVAGSAGFLPEIEADPARALDALPTTDLAALVHKGIATPLATVQLAELWMRPLDLTRACDTLGCK